MQRVRGLKEARDALARGITELASEPFAACYAGVNYFQAMLAQLRSEFPTTEFTFTLCCGDNPAIAHDALRMGFTQVRCDCADGQFLELQRLADRCKAAVERSGESYGH